MTTMRARGDYLVYHQVNTCLMAIVFGAELGLTKPQLRDLGYIALFHDAGMATLPDELATKRGGADPGGAGAGRRRRRWSRCATS